MNEFSSTKIPIVEHAPPGIQVAFDINVLADEQSKHLYYGEVANGEQKDSVDSNTVISQASVAGAVNKSLPAKTDKKKYQRLAGGEEVILPNGDITTIAELQQNMGETDIIPIHCISPDHPDVHPSGHLSMNKEGVVFAGCQACDYFAYYNPDLLVKAKDEKAEAVFIPQIDTELALGLIDHVEKAMKKIALDVIDAFPVFEFGCFDDVKADHYVNNFRMNSLFPLAKVNSKLCLYYMGYWRQFRNDHELRQFINRSMVKNCGGKIPAKLKRTITEIIEELLEEYVAADFEEEKVRINLQNGVLTFSNDGVLKIIPHDKDHAFVYKLAHSYDETIDTTDAFNFCLESIEEVEAVKVFFEYLGSAFISNSVLNMEKMLILHGSGSNGKSVLLNLTTEVFGIDNISNVEMHELSNDNKLQLIEGKLVNFGTEINHKKTDSSLVKRAASAETMVVDVKYGKSTTIRDIPKMVYATNSLPTDSSDVTKGYFRRFIIINFDRVFDYRKKDPEFIPNVMKFAPAMLNLIIEGVQRLLANGEFTYSPKIEAASMQFERSLDSVSDFIIACEVVVPDASLRERGTLRADLFTAYSRHCNNEGLQPYGKTKFYAAIRGKGIEGYKSNGRRFRVFINNPPESPSFGSSTPLPDYVAPTAPLFGQED